MVEENRSKLNLLEQSLPQGLLADAAWLERLGITSSLRSYYAKNGWLEQLARGVYRRPRGAMTETPVRWQQVVISVQALLHCPLVIGGATALELHGLSHCLTPNLQLVHLYGEAKAPGWLNQLGLPQRFIIHRSAPLFRESSAGNSSSGAKDSVQDQGIGVESLPWGEWNWPLILSSPERAYLEFLDGLPRDASFHQADMIMQGAVNFRPRRLIELLTACKSIKVKRLFFLLADRHPHAWRKKLSSDDFDLGKGKRMLVRGGRLDSTYLITVPEDLDVVH